ncbi:MAG: ATP synthase F0 subunit B [Planctomycetales bacterium]|nr:ATP synthase F0 subunit B [Planctomycetales bacterium]
MSPTVTTFLFEAANFLALAAAMGWLFFKPVRQALLDRQAKFESDNLQATQKLADAEKVQNEANAIRANLQTELNGLRASELEAARRQADKILTEARSVAQREREMSQRQAARISETQRDTLAEVAAVAAAETIGRFLTQIGGPNLQSALIESACQQLRSLSHDSLAPVTVESTQPLLPERVASIKNALGPAGEAAEFRTVENLGDGIRVSTGEGLIDATVKGLVQYASQSLVKEMSRRANNHNPLQKTNDV